jgi:hypothetical protein
MTILLLQDQFKAIVGRAVRDLQRVQKSIAQLLTFFAEVSNNVQVLVADCHKTMVGELEGSMDDFLFPEYTRNVRDNSHTDYFEGNELTLFLRHTEHPRPRNDIESLVRLHRSCVWSIHRRLEEIHPSRPRDDRSVGPIFSLLIDGAGGAAEPPASKGIY